jgi:hypothetical protein
MKFLLPSFTGAVFGFLAGILLAPGGQILMHDNGVISQTELVNITRIDTEGKDIAIIGNLILTPSFSWRLTHLSWNLH